MAECAARLGAHGAPYGINSSATDGTDTPTKKAPLRCLSPAETLELDIRKPPYLKGRRLIGMAVLQRFDRIVNQLVGNH